ncbi:MAG: FAD-dependent oxidoreductase [Anaerolineales bacterium]|jgi:D-amino-acid dehydrogenase|nr:FAD-dependent oxidoreductase [Anaerolineales bacterium]
MTTKTDVLIIGGGAIGLNAAYYLLKSGRSVTVLDRDAIGQGSSAGNAGHIVPSHIIPLAAPGVIPTAIKWMLDPPNSPFGLKVSLSPAYLAWLIRFSAACNEANVRRAIPPFKWLGLLSAQNFARMMAEEKFSCSYQETGLLFLYKTEAAFAAGRHEAEQIRQHELPAEILDKAALHQREPAALDDVIGGVDFTGDSSLHPGEFLRLLKKRVHEMGAELRENTPVTEIEATAGRITRIVTPTEEFEPALVVLAAGAWSPQVGRGLGLRLPIQPARGYSLTMPATKIMPRGALLLGERKVAVTPLGDKLRFTGRLEIGEMSTQPNLRWIVNIERAVREYIQMDAQLAISETWAGLRPTTPDGMPILGLSARYENLILATGHAMLGLSLGPGTGQVVAELANGIAPGFDLQAFSPQRF